MPQPLVHFSDYGFQYRAQAAPTLKNIDFSLYSGEKIFIAGPSGCGKSTLANCINGLIPFNYKGSASGTLRINGIETTETSMFDLSQIVGTVLQDPDGQFVGLTAGEDIAFSLENDCVPLEEMRRRVQDAATLAGIENHLEESPYDLSGGQKQRVSIAGVLINEITLLLFDEPLANLDPATGKQMIEQIDNIMAKTGVTVLIIEHRLEDVLHRDVDRILLVNDGKIISDTPPDELLCSELLRDNGIREPLYLTVLKYAGVTIVPEMHPSRIDHLQLNEQEKEAVRKWFHTNHPPGLPEKKTELLRLENVSFSYEESKTVLKNISFSIHAGEITAIAGTNGAGKSTLAKLICGFEKPSSGDIYLHDKNLADRSISERAEYIGYVMQNPNQMISKTIIYDEVALGLRSRNVPEEEIAIRVDKTLKICGLYPFRKWPVSALSFGQKKRVTIASILVLNPEIIILDEPTAGQDFRHYTEIMEFLRQLNEQGITVLMITHDMHLMLEYAPRALVFHEGRLLADRTSAEVLTNPEITEAASLKQTSLFQLASICGLQSQASQFVQHFIDYDREVRKHA